MNDLPSKFQSRIDRINVIYGLVVPVSLMTVIALLTWLILPDYFQSGSLLIYILVITSVSAVFALHLGHINNLSAMRLKTMYGYYHVALIVFCLFVAPYRSPYEFLWLILAVGMDMVFKRHWMYLTLGLYATVLVMVFMRTDQDLTTTAVLVSILQYIGVFTTSFLVSRYRRISDEEHHALAEASHNNLFEHQRLLSLINNMGEAVFATNQSGKILLYNASVLELLDTNQSLEGKQLDSVVKLINKQGKHVKLSALIKDTKVGFTSTDYRHQFAPSDAMNVYINIAPIRLGFKQKLDTNYIILMRDITKEKSLEEERDEFISVVSHELRTPVAIAEGNISNALFAGKQAKSSKTVLSALDEAHEQVIFLSRMINDLATLSRAERTDVPLEITEVDPSELLHAVALDYEPDAQKKKLKLTASVAKGSKPLYTSELYLREILQNFVTNAIKYTKKGSILLHVRSDEAGNAIFSVADSGIGLSKTDRKHIFDKFFRSEDFRTRESSGTGLGLYVTAKLARRLKATIDIESQLNKGSTFTVTVPPLPAPKRTKK